MLPRVCQTAEKIALYVLGSEDVSENGVRAEIRRAGVMAENTPEQWKWYQ